MIRIEDIDMDEIAMSASALLNQYRKRGINDEIEIRETELNFGTQTHAAYCIIIFIFMYL